MAANCDVCGKGPGFGHSISHSHRRTKRRWKPQHPAHQGSGRCCGCDPEASQCLRVMPQGRQGQALSTICALPLQCFPKNASDADLLTEVGFAVCG